MPWGSRGGYPARSSRGGGTLPGPAGGGGTLPGPAGGGGVPWLGGVHCQVQPGRVPWPGGYPGQGVACRGVPWWGSTLPGEGTQLGQHREYLLHGGRYASCVHAGGLSCFEILLVQCKTLTRLFVNQ